ncbi:hypothetical protein KM043_009905 [Ampulex compressa]|nr:hypothetical protein KM043_009905 [Ampulex compressa]
MAGRNAPGALSQHPSEGSTEPSSATKRQGDFLRVPASGQSDVQLFERTARGSPFRLSSSRVAELSLQRSYSVADINLVISLPHSCRPRSARPRAKVIDNLSHDLRLGASHPSSARTRPRYPTRDRPIARTFRSPVMTDD